MSNIKTLKNKILSKKALISIIGLGYVGLPLAVEFVRKGFKVRGIDKDIKKINSIKRGQSYILDISNRELTEVRRTTMFKVTSDFTGIRESDVIIICVPTPLRKTGEPDLSHILEVANKIKKNIKKNTLVVLESTTYPGTTEEIILPLLSNTGYKIGRDFYLAFSPERIDPGNKKFKTRNIPKVIAGVTRNCLDLAKLVYAQITDKIVPVSSPRVAEMVKLLENSFRSVNIALANETALVCNKLGIDVWEVINAAKSKPFGYMPFYPGPGIGGHCIPADPMYLVWKARISGYEPRLIKTAQEINSFMPHYIVDKIITALNFRKKTLKGAKILIVGVAYKPDVNDLRESPALEIIQELVKKGARISYYDPYVKELRLGEKKYKSVCWRRENISKRDCAVIVTNHSTIDYSLLKNISLVVDTRNVLKWRSKNLIKI